MVPARNVAPEPPLSNILHAMLGKGLGGLEQVFLDYQPILEAWAARHGGRCVGVVRQGGKVAAAQGARTPPFATMPAYTDWDPLTVGAARALVRDARPDLILSHGQRPARVFAKVAPAGAVQAICVHKPVFDIRPGVHYLCVGRHLARLAIERGAPADHVHFIPNAVTPPTARAEPFTRAEGPVRIVAAGRLHPKKGFDVLIRAVGKLRAWDLDVVCEIAGEGDERGALEGLIRELDLDPCVKLVGWRQDVADFLATGDLFAFPSHQEGFPLTLLEAMAVGLPVVASEIEGPIEMIKDGVDGRLVPEDDADRLAEALGELIGDRDGARRLGEAARALVLEQYGPDQLARRLEAALDGMLS
ncbi:glycosyl transferase group 1 [Caulobacter segnis ATCC 21756]|uniref:Glycosyl transferase group 1 n=1 Tax=Caulobacter segnis (strain ATCC 21756 / DSM 7131 / JCM 7823 / NBRC 15250 / LMG 17158 / TK0059) TaxID=509190 RepID=D5VI39_CAUST|nr:glycosyl transferase group 1 [Caulobacter segnis ATCC 21756]